MTGATSKSAFVAFNCQKNDLSIIFMRYFLHVRSSVGNDKVHSYDILVDIRNCVVSRCSLHVDFF